MITTLILGPTVVAPLVLDFKGARWGLDTSHSGLSVPLLSAPLQQCCQQPNKLKRATLSTPVHQVFFLVSDPVRYYRCLRCVSSANHVFPTHKSDQASLLAYGCLLPLHTAA